MYITLNRQSEWERALLIGLEIDGHIVRGASRSGGIADRAVMITGCIDSFDYDHIWDRINLVMETAPNTSCRISYLASNTDKQDIGGKLVDFNAWLIDGKISPEERVNKSEGLFTPIVTAQSAGAQSTGAEGDGLISSRGQYLWIRLDIIAENREAFILRSIKLKLPSEHITDYLPEVYTKGLTEKDFFPRFMAVYDSVFFDIEEDVDRIGQNLDYRTASAEMLAYQASWLGLGSAAASEDRLRSLIGSAVKELRMSGTKEGLECAVEEQTGHKPIIVEHFQVESMAREGKSRQTYGTLFGSNPYKVYIMLPEEALSSREKISAIASRVESCVPAHVEFEIVPLRSNVLLDRHTYLDVNTALGGYHGMVVEEKSTLHHDVFIDKKGEDKNND